MDTLQIESFGKKNPYTKRIFAGVYPSNFLPKRKLPNSRLPITFIINLCESFRTIDCHWVAVHITKDVGFDKGKVFYFDSGGEASYLGNDFVHRFLLQQEKKIIFNKIQIQSLESDRCGLHVLMFLYCNALGMHPGELLRAFNATNLNENDAIVDKLFKCAYLRNGKGECFGQSKAK